jgi:hypothetical protein
MVKGVEANANHALEPCTRASRFLEADAARGGE